MIRPVIDPGLNGVRQFVNYDSERQSLTEAELAGLVQTLYAPLLLYARQLCSIPEDIVQEAFLELQRCPPQIGGPQSVAPEQRVIHLRAWLFRTVRHRALNGLRSEQRRQRYESAYATQRAWFDQPSDSKIETDEAVAALQGLADELRETVIARLWGNLTLQEIADLTDVSIATAQRRYIRGIEQLRQRLDLQERVAPSAPRKQS